MSIFLIAQTPRAGLRNHNFVIPTDVPILIPEVQEYLNTAIFKPEGKNYIAVSQMVEQVADGRMGREMLMLVGLDVEKLSNEQREAVRSKLQDYLSSDFATLVTQTIDWNKYSGNFIERSELVQWGQDDVFIGLPQFVKTETLVIPAHEETEEDSIFSSSNKFQSFFEKKNIIRLLGIVLVLMITAASVKQCTKEEQESLKQKYAQTPAESNQNPYDKYNTFLPFDCQVSNENPKALEEIRTLCSVVSEVDDSTEFWKELQEDDNICNDKLELSPDKDVNQETFLQFVNKTKTKLENLLDNSFPNDMSLDDGKMVNSLVESRRKLRRLHNALFQNNPYDEKVCLPFFTDEDVKITSKLDEELKGSGIKLVDCLKTDDFCTSESVKQHKLVRLRKKIEETIAVNTYEDKENAIKELEALGYDKLKQLEKKLDSQEEKIKMIDLVMIFISNEYQNKKKPISELLGFKDNHFLKDQTRKLPKVVAVRNDLRKLDIALNGKHKSNIVYLPFFTSEDVTIIKSLNTKLEGSGIKLVDCLAKDICSPEYVIFNKLNNRQLGLLKLTYDAIIKELEALGYDKLKKLESQNSFNMSDLVVLISDDEDKKRIYELFGLDKNKQISKFKQIVEVRNALRELDAALNGNSPKTVYLPFFSDDDVTIINDLRGRLNNAKLVTQKENLLEGLKEISEIAEQVNNKKYQQKLMTIAINNLKECSSSGNLNACISKDLYNFSGKNINFNALSEKINKLTDSIKEVRKP